jgi:hypothetical protein
LGLPRRRKRRGAETENSPARQQASENHAAETLPPGTLALQDDPAASLVPFASVEIMERVAPIGFSAERQIVNRNEGLVRVPKVTTQFASGLGCEFKS